MQLSTAQMIAIMVAIVVMMSRVFSSIYVSFYGLLSAKLIVILHLAKTFSKKNRPNSCPFQSYCLPLPSLEFLCGALHINKGRGYMFKPDQNFYRLWAYFFAHNLPHQHGVYALCLCGALHIVWRCSLKIYGGSPSTCFFALCGGSHESSSRRGSASRFFRTLSSTVPGGSRDKARTLILCKQLHQFSARLSCARWASARLRSRLGSTQRAK